MGVVRYLCITIVLASLMLAAIAGDCNDNGWKNDHGDCVCDSGFRGADCSDAFGSVCKPDALPATPTKDDRFPKLDLDTQGDYINFTANYLTLSVAGPIVPHRRYNSITFLQSRAGEPATKAQCGLIGALTASSIWTQPAATYKDASVANATCHDRFFLNMFWPMWHDCGFVEDTTQPINYVFTNTFKLNYTDALGPNVDIEGVSLPPLRRTTVVSYKVWIKFRKSLTIVTMLTVEVNNTVGLKAAVTKFEYNPANNVLSIGFSSAVTWPNMYLKQTVTLQHNDQNNAITVNPNPTGMTDADHYDSCDVDHGNCLQYFEFNITLNSGCTFDDYYIITGIVATCRDLITNPDVNGDQCTRATQDFKLDVSGSDVCGHVTAEPTISGQLVSLAPDLSAKKSNFEIGYYGEFTVIMTTQNDFNLTWIDIWAVADEDLLSGTDHSQWLVLNGEIQKQGFYNHDGNHYDPSETMVTADDIARGPCNLTIHDLAPATNPEVSGRRVFTQGFRFRFDPRIFYVPLTAGDDTSSDIVKGYTLHGRGRITYASNEAYVKRSEEVVEFVFETGGAEAEASTWVGLRAVESKSAEKPLVAVTPSSSSNQALVATLAPVVGVALVAIAAAVIIAVVIVKKKKSNSFARLAN